MTGVVRVVTPAAEVVVDARLRGAVVGLVAAVEEQGALLSAVGRALRFPAYYEPNLDALEECLRDLSWLPAGEVVLVWDGADALRRADPRGHRVVLGILTGVVEETAASRRPLRVVLAGAAPVR